MSWKVVDEDVSSPHSPILLRVGSKADLPPRQAIDWKNFDWGLYESKSAAFLGNLIEIWESNCEQEAERSPNEMVSELQTGLTDIVAEIAPMKTISVHSKPWISPEISLLMKELRELRKRYQQRKSEQNRLLLEEKRENLRIRWKTAKLEYLRTECNKLQDASDKEQWSIINRLTNSHAQIGIQPIEVVNADGSSWYAFEDEDLFEQFEDYHISKPGMSDVRDKKEEIKAMEDQARNECQEDNIMSAPISLDEVDKTFNSCLGAPGPDGFKGVLLDKASRESMRKCLGFLWNKVWEKGVFVSEWKNELRTVMAKPGKDSYHKINAYRTISLTAVLGKRMEKITCNRLKAVLLSSNFDPDQFAYLDNRSASQAILMLIETIQEGLNQGKSVGAVFFDFSDAFGCVDRSRLLHKLQSDFKITGRLFLHIADFLSNRKARLNIRSNLGEWLDSNIGTSAGTVLGPLLFVAFTHDVPKEVKPKFADDLTAVEIASSQAERRERLQKRIDEMDQWAVINGMELNSKTKIMAFGGKIKIL